MKNITEIVKTVGTIATVGVVAYTLIAKPKYDMEAIIKDEAERVIADLGLVGMKYELVSEDMGCTAAVCKASYTYTTQGLFSRKIESITPQVVEFSVPAMERMTKNLTPLAIKKNAVAEAFIKYIVRHEFRHWYQYQNHHLTDDMANKFSYVMNPNDDPMEMDADTYAYKAVTNKLEKRLTANLANSRSGKVVFR